MTNGLQKKQADYLFMQKRDLMGLSASGPVLSLMKMFLGIEFGNDQQTRPEVFLLSIEILIGIGIMILKRQGITGFNASTKG